MAALCFDKTECSWLLQYVWVEKEQTLIISTAQRGSGRANGFIRGYWLFVKPFNVPDNQPHTGKLTATSFLLFFLPPPPLLVLTAKGEAGLKLT